MNAETYLDRIKKINSMIRNKKRERARASDEADGLGGASLGERVQTSRNLHRVSDAIDAYIDIDREIAALEQERQSIIQTIEQLPSDEYDVIYKLYVGEYDAERDITQYYTLKEVAYHMGRSYKWVMIKKQNALKLIQSMLDEKVGDIG